MNLCWCHFWGVFHMSIITVYELSHWNKTENDVIEKLAGDGKLLGFFSSRKKCKNI